jgi:hypothetical protein
MYKKRADLVTHLFTTFGQIRADDFLKGDHVPSIRLQQAKKLGELGLEISAFVGLARFLSLNVVALAIEFLPFHPRRARLLPRMGEARARPTRDRWLSS